MGPATEGTRRVKEPLNCDSIVGKWSKNKGRNPLCDLVEKVSNPASDGAQMLLKEVFKKRDEMRTAMNVTSTGTKRRRKKPKVPYRERMKNRTANRKKNRKKKPSDSGPPKKTNSAPSIQQHAQEQLENEHGRENEAKNQTDSGRDGSNFEQHESASSPQGTVPVYVGRSAKFPSAAKLPNELASHMPLNVSENAGDVMELASMKYRAPAFSPPIGLLAAVLGLCGLLAFVIVRKKLGRRTRLGTQYHAFQETEMILMTMDGEDGA